MAAKVVAPAPLICICGKIVNKLAGGKSLEYKLYCDASSHRCGGMSKFSQATPVPQTWFPIQGTFFVLNGLYSISFTDHAPGLIGGLMAHVQVAVITPHNGHGAFSAGALHVSGNAVDGKCC